MKQLVSYLVFSLSLASFNAVAEESSHFKSFNDITAALNPLDVIANHDGIQRSIDLNIQFKKNSAELLPAAQRQIKVLSEALNSNHLNGYNIQVIGHTDASGNDKTNMTLSELRALAVLNALVKGYQVDERRLSSLGKGETALLKGIPENDARHRRVEIVAVAVQDGLQLQPAAKPAQNTADETPTALEETTESGDKVIAW